MGVLNVFYNATFFFAALAPPIMHYINVDTSDNDDCIGTVVLMFKQDE